MYVIILSDDPGGIKEAKDMSVVADDSIDMDVSWGDHLLSARTDSWTSIFLIGLKNKYVIYGLLSVDGS